MKHPFWILNDTLVVLLAGALCFVIFAQKNPLYYQKLPKKLSKASPAKAILAPHPIELSSIYEADLFGTYYEKKEPPVETITVQPLPQPPSQSMVTVPEEPSVPFLAPLEVTLKGIMSVADDRQSRAIIEDNQTKKEEVYKVGDILDDAQVIRILGNKVILIRSNGQLETLYLSEKETSNDPQFNAKKIDWSNIISTKEHNSFVIHPHLFMQEIPTIAHLIETLDITSVYKKGKSIGCRVGLIERGSLGDLLGLETHDVITKIVEIAPTNTENRFKIYNTLIQYPFKKPFTIDIERSGNTITLTYQLEVFDELEKEMTEPTKDEAKLLGIIQQPSPQEIEQHKIKILKEKHKFAPTVQDILALEQEKMIQEGSQKRLKDFSPTYEV